MPEHPPPLQPMNVELPAGLAVRVTPVPGKNGYQHEVPELMAAGLLLTVPEPVPPLMISSMAEGSIRMISDSEAMPLVNTVTRAGPGGKSFDPRAVNSLSEKGWAGSGRSHCIWPPAMRCSCMRG